MAVTLDYSDVLKMKKAVYDVFHLNVHFHDGCGGQYFSLDEAPANELKDFIIRYFNNIGFNVKFSNDSMIFTLEHI